MNYTFVAMTQEYATTLVDTWKYENEYAIYDYANEADHILDTESWGTGLFAILNAAGDLIGEVSIEFLDAQGLYTEYRDFENEALINQRDLWIGFGLRPDLVGDGRGAEFVAACVDFAIRQCRYRGAYVYLGVAIFNQRAIRAYEKAGFQIVEHTVGDIGGKAYDCVSMRKQL
jgi:ribosomal-protein-alanine N-acetyltransferase